VVVVTDTTSAVHQVDLAFVVRILIVRLVTPTSAISAILALSSIIMVYAKFAISTVRLAHAHGAHQQQLVLLVYQLVPNLLLSELLTEHVKCAPTVPLDALPLQHQLYAPHATLDL